MFNINIKKIAIVFFALFFCVSLVFNGWMVYQLSMALKVNELKQNNAKVLNFTGMFVEDVLMASQDIDFDTRLTLETAVRSLNDQDIFSQWQRFTKASDKELASNEAKILLDLLINKIEY
jgi:hypothetical protein